MYNQAGVTFQEHTIYFLDMLQSIVVFTVYMSLRKYSIHRKTAVILRMV